MGASYLKNNGYSMHLHICAYSYLHKCIFLFLEKIFLFFVNFSVFTQNMHGKNIGKVFLGHFLGALIPFKHNQNALQYITGSPYPKNF